MGGFINLVGKKYSLLTVVSYMGNSNWRCDCECGRFTFVNGDHLKTGHTKSCGCIRKPKPGHRESNIRTTKEYRAWSHIKARCYNPKDKAYHNYGGRGITVCDRWRASYENFLADMGRAPSPKHSIDRIKNELGYSKENCRWADKIHQANNTRKTIMVTYLGKTQPLCFWCRELNIKRTTVFNRLRRGWTPERALDVPLEQQILERKRITKAIIPEIFPYTTI